MRTATTSLFIFCCSIYAASATAVELPCGTAPGGIYVGYYQEDPVTNPEDPPPGAFVLSLPEYDASFDGSECSAGFPF